MGFVPKFSKSSTVEFPSYARTKAIKRVSNPNQNVQSSLFPSAKKRNSIAEPRSFGGDTESVSSTISDHVNFQRVRGTEEERSNGERTYLFHDSQAFSGLESDNSSSNKMKLRGKMNTNVTVASPASSKEKRSTSGTATEFRPSPLFNTVHVKNTKNESSKGPSESSTWVFHQIAQTQYNSESLLSSHGNEQIHVPHNDHDDDGDDERSRNMNNSIFPKHRNNINSVNNLGTQITYVEKIQPLPSHPLNKTPQIVPSMLVYKQRASKSVPRLARPSKSLIVKEVMGSHNKPLEEKAPRKKQDEIKVNSFSRDASYSRSNDHDRAHPKSSSQKNTVGRVAENGSRGSSNVLGSNHHEQRNNHNNIPVKVMSSSSPIQNNHHSNHNGLHSISSQLPLQKEIHLHPTAFYVHPPVTELHPPTSAAVIMEHQIHPEVSHSHGSQSSPSTSTASHHHDGHSQTQVGLRYDINI
jgi:hypothetical protein